MQQPVITDTVDLERRLGLISEDDTMITLQVHPSRPRHYLTITPDGRIEPGPDLIMNDVAQQFLHDCSKTYRRLEQRSTRMERLLRECRHIIRSLGLRSVARAFWEELDALLGPDSEESTTEELLSAHDPLRRP